MARLRSEAIRAMTPEERQRKLQELRTELMHERGVSAMGGAPPSPGRLGALRRDIARLLTIIKEETREDARGGEPRVDQEETT